MNQVMHHEENLSVVLEDNIFDQMMLMDLYLKKNLYEHLEVENEKMDKEMLMMRFGMANYQQNIYLNQPMEEMLELEKYKNKNENYF